MKARLMTVLALSVLAALAGADDPKEAVKTPDTPAGQRGENGQRQDGH